MALSHGATFRKGKLPLFLLPHCEFPVVCCCQAFSRAQSQHNKSFFARTAAAAVDTASRSHLCQRKLTAILGDRSRFFDHRNFDIKSFTLRYVLAFCSSYCENHDVMSRSSKVTAAELWGEFWSIFHVLSFPFLIKSHCISKDLFQTYIGFHRNYEQAKSHGKDLPRGKFVWESISP